MRMVTTPLWLARKFGCGANTSLYLVVSAGRDTLKAATPCAPVLAESTTVNGVAQTTAGAKSYSIGGDLSQRLPGTFFLRANADYFSSIVTQQTYQQDLMRATNRTRRFGTYVNGTLAGLQMPATADRTFSRCEIC